MAWLHGQERGTTARTGAIRPFWGAMMLAQLAKPGAHLLAFGGTRTVHRLAAAIEDAGWESATCWFGAYASGFPKSLDVEGDRQATR